MAHAQQPLIAGFLARLGARPADGPAWLTRLRRAGAEATRAEGLPHAKVEAWRWTRLGELAAIPFDPDAPASAVDALPADRLPDLPGALRLVFVNGRARPDLSDAVMATTGVVVSGLAERLAVAPDDLSRHVGRILDPQGMPFAALNAALWEDGLVLKLADGVRLQRPIHLVSITGSAEVPALASPRLLVIGGRGSAATLVESHLGIDDAATLAVPVSEIAVGEQAHLLHVKTVAAGPRGYHLAGGAVSLAAGARYRGFVLALGGRLVRNEVHLRLEDAGAEARLDGAYVAGRAEHVDTTVFIDHAAGGATSRMVFKGVLGGDGRGVFQGKVLVRPHAQGTDAHQLHKAILLSPGAEVDAKPELEIYADDVKCGHGATAGRIDEDALFYLRARGLPNLQARALLTEAFLGEAIDRVDDESLGAGLRALAVRRLGPLVAGEGIER